MAEVVSVSDPSPFEAFSTGLSMLEFSVSKSWSGTGITSVNQTIEPRVIQDKLCKVFVILQCTGAII